MRKGFKARLLILQILNRVGIKIQIFPWTKHALPKTIPVLSNNVEDQVVQSKHMHAISQSIHLAGWEHITCHPAGSAEVNGIVEIATDFRPMVTTIHSVVMGETESTNGYHISYIAQEVINHPLL